MAQQAHEKECRYLNKQISLETNIPLDTFLQVQNYSRNELFKLDHHSPPEIVIDLLIKYQIETEDLNSNYMMRQPQYSSLYNEILKWNKLVLKQRMEGLNESKQQSNKSYPSLQQYQELITALRKNMLQISLSHSYSKTHFQSLYQWFWLHKARLFEGKECGGNLQPEQQNISTRPNTQETQNVYFDEESRKRQTKDKTQTALDKLAHNINTNSDFPARYLRKNNFLKKKPVNLDHESHHLYMMRDWGHTKSRVQEQLIQHSQIIEYNSGGVLKELANQKSNPKSKDKDDESLEFIDFTNIKPSQMQHNLDRNASFNYFEKGITSAKLKRLKSARVNLFVRGTNLGASNQNRVNSSQSARSYSSKFQTERSVIVQPKQFSHLYSLINQKRVQYQELNEINKVKSNLASKRISVSLKTLQKSLQTPMSEGDDGPLPNPGEHLSEQPYLLIQQIRKQQKVHRKSSKKRKEK